MRHPCSFATPGAPGLVGEWSMHSHDQFGGSYVAGKSLVLHADGRAESRNLLRRDVMSVCDGGGDIPLPQFGTWCLVEGESPSSSTLVVNFGQPVELMAKFYRRNSWFYFGELEIWFHLETDPDVPLWSCFVRPKMEAVKAAPGDLVGTWQMTKHVGSKDLQYGKGKTLVLRADGTGECHGLTGFDLDWENSEVSIPMPISWKLREDNGWIELWQEGEFLTHARLYKGEGGQGVELRFELLLEPNDPLHVYFERLAEPTEGEN